MAPLPPGWGETLNGEPVPGGAESSYGAPAAAAQPPCSISSGNS